MELRGIVLGDRYCLERRIAAGGMGQVWRAADEVLGRPVAVKLLRPEYAEHPETLKRFRAEARHAGVLSHPHIAQVYDYGHGYAWEGRGAYCHPYLVLEYVDGPSLAHLIERGPLGVEVTCDLIAQAADGLAAAHQARLVHRDVKPGNMLLTSDGRVKVTDFGIAHAAGSAPITAPGIVMGTARYMAPERIAGGAGTPASDLYSLGIVMYECLSGMVPFAGTSADVMAAHLHQALPPLPDRVPDRVAELVARLTAKDPSYRIRDAALLASRLRSLEPVAAGARSQRSRQPDLAAPVHPARLAATIAPVRPAPTREIHLTQATRHHDARRQGVGVVVTTAAVAGLAAIGLAAASVLRPTPVTLRDATGPSAAATAAGARYVQVPDGSLAGRQLATVIQRLHSLGLAPKVAWTQRSGHPAGTVLSVRPTGPVPPGAAVTVTVAR